jgi:alkylation response protein AidB-like acyl-CoA dehydrogenase
MDFALTDEHELIRQTARELATRQISDRARETLYEGTSQIQKLNIGRALTGIDALVPS